MQNNVRSNINIDTFRVGKKCCGLRNYFLVLVIIALPAQVLFLVHWFTRSRGIIFQNKFILYLYFNLLRTQNRTITFLKKELQGDPNQNLLLQMAISQEIRISNPMLVKPKCVLKAFMYFHFSVVCLQFSAVCIQF